MLSASLNKTFPSFLPNSRFIFWAWVSLNIHSFINPGGCLNEVATWAGVIINYVKRMTVGLLEALLCVQGMSSMVEYPLMVWWIVGLMADPLSYFSLHPVIYNLCNKEGNVLFNDAFNTFYFTLISCRTYGKGPLR